MARREPSWVLQRRAQQAAARENFYATRNDNEDTFNANVESLPRIGVGYRSSNVLIGETPAPAQLIIRASESAVKWFEGVAETGALTAGNARLGLEYVDLEDFLPITKFDVAKIHAVLGATTPTAKRTPWGTRYISYTKTGEGSARSSYTAPISKKTGPITTADLQSAAQTIASLPAIRTEIKENGRMWFEPESDDYTLNTDT